MTDGRYKLLTKRGEVTKDLDRLAEEDLIQAKHDLIATKYQWGLEKLR